MTLKILGHKIGQSQKISVFRPGSEYREFVSSIEYADPLGITITTPITRHNVMDLIPGDLLVIRVPLESFIMEFDARVLSYREDNVSLVVLEPPASYRRIQRRKCYRMKSLLNVRIAYNPDNPDVDPLFSEALALNISAGGMEVITQVDFDLHDILLVKFELPLYNKKIHRFLVKSEVCRVTPVSPRKRKVAFKFLNLPTVDADKIVQYIFKAISEKESWMR
ncbi:MAG: flagellar brake protein [Bacillota bacterium]